MQGNHITNGSLTNMQKSTTFLTWVDALSQLVYLFKQIKLRYYKTH